MKQLLTVIKRIHKPACGASLQRYVSGGPFSAPDQALIVGSSRELVQKLRSQVQVRTAFITEEEEQALLRELDPGLKKKRYEFDHWDDVSLINCVFFSQESRGHHVRVAYCRILTLKVKLFLSHYSNKVILKEDIYIYSTHLLPHNVCQACI